MHSHKALVLAFSLLLAPIAALAETAKTIDSARIRLGDLVEVKRELAQVDLGPAPPPGGSRLLPRAEVLRKLRANGVRTAPKGLPPVLRVKSASRHLSVDELRELSIPLLQKVLPSGVTLSAVRPARPLEVSPKAELKNAKLPRLPKRAGSTTTTATLELWHGDRRTMLLPLQITLIQSEQAASPDVQKGDTLRLTITRGTARISAQGLALGDVDLGQIASFKVVKTRRILRARLVSRQHAEVIVE